MARSEPKTLERIAVRVDMAVIVPSRFGCGSRYGCVSFTPLRFRRPWH